MQFGTLRGGVSRSYLALPGGKYERGVNAFVLDRLPHTRICRVVIAAYFTKRLSATPRTTVGTLCNGTITARRTDVAVAIHMLDLAVGNHSRRSMLSQFSKQYTDAFTGQFEFLNLLGSRIALFVKLRL